MSDDETRIGFVGVGRMGANMVRRLKDQGYRIAAVQDRHTEASESLARELGLEAAVSPARVAELSNIVITVVSDDAAMQDSYAEQDPTGLMAHAKNRPVHQLCDSHPGASYRHRTGG